MQGGRDGIQNRSAACAKWALWREAFLLEGGEASAAAVVLWGVPARSRQSELLSDVRIAIGVLDQSAADRHSRQRRPTRDLWETEIMHIVVIGHLRMVVEISDSERGDRDGLAVRQCVNGADRTR